MYNAKLRYSLIYLLLIACSDKHDSLYKSITALDKNIFQEGKYVIIPNQGCEGCISYAESFVKKHIDDTTDIRYIFTKIQSVKLLRIKLGSTIIANNKILLDTNNIIIYPEKKNEIYPMVAYIREGHIQRIKYQNPEENGLQELITEK